MGHGSRTHFALPPAGVHVSGAGPKACDDLRVPYREGALVMPSICLLSATRAGQMRRMAAHVAAARREHGCAVTITHVRDHATRSRLNAYTAAMGVTSVHAGATHPTCSRASRDLVARWHACPPFLHAVHSALLLGKDMVWQRFWRHLAAALGRHPRCMASVPPDKNASVVLARVSPPNRCGKASRCMGSVQSPIVMKATKGSYATLWQRRGDNVSAEATACQGTTG